MPSAMVRSDSFDLWEDRVCHTFLPLRARREGAEHGFAGGLDAATLGSVLLADISASGALVERTPKLIRSEDPESYKFSLQLSGVSVLEQDDRQAVLRPGDLAIYDTSRPYRLTFSDDFRMVVAMFPKTMVRLPHRRMRTQTAVALDSSSGTNVYIAHLLGGLSAQLGEARNGPETHLDPHLGDAIVDLVSASYAGRLPEGGRTPQEEGLGSLVDRATVIVESRLGDSTLSSQTVAQTLFVSVRYLQKAFEAEGTSLSALIRERRLEQCRRDLADPSCDEVPIAQVAARWGLRDPAHFSRIFRRAFGTSPREYRRSRSASTTPLQASA